MRAPEQQLADRGHQRGAQLAPAPTKHAGSVLINNGTWFGRARDSGNGSTAITNNSLWLSKRLQMNNAYAAAIPVSSTTARFPSPSPTRNDVQQYLRPQFGGTFDIESGYINFINSRLTRRPAILDFGLSGEPGRPVVPAAMSTSMALWESAFAMATRGGGDVIALISYARVGVFATANFRSHWRVNWISIMDRLVTLQAVAALAVPSPLQISGWSPTTTTIPFPAHGFRDHVGGATCSNGSFEFPSIGTRLHYLRIGCDNITG